MAEDLSYLRARLDDACSGITRLEALMEGVTKHITRCDEMSVVVTTQENRLKVLEAAREKGGSRVWEVVAIVIAAVVGAVSGRWGK